MKNICIIIPMFGKAELTNKCIDFCRSNAGIEHDILVVDDGSSEPFVHAGVEVLRLEKNSGFTAATNAGILWCSDRYKYIHLLNNDTEPCENFLKSLYDVLENEENEVVGIAGSVRIVDYQGRKVFEVNSVDLVSGMHAFNDKLEEIPDLVHSYWFPLCSAMIRHSLIREIGLLDKRMKMWCSDNDFCIRANFAGYNSTIVKASLVAHAQQATTGKASLAGIKADQDVLLNKIMNMGYAVLCDKMPLDASSKTFGKVDFKVYRK